MNFKIKFAILSILLSVGSFFVGYMYSKNEAKYMEKRYEYLNLLNLLAAYQGHAGISEKIKSGDVGAAECMADIRASAEYDELRKCMKEDRCGSLIKKDVEENSPELLNPKGGVFKYYKNGEACGKKPGRSD